MFIKKDVLLVIDIMRVLATGSSISPVALSRVSFLRVVSAHDAQNACII